jgi:hypothetical protein
MSVFPKGNGATQAAPALIAERPVRVVATRAFRADHTANVRVTMMAPSGYRAAACCAVAREFAGSLVNVSQLFERARARRQLFAPM